MERGRCATGPTSPLQLRAGPQPPIGGHSLGLNGQARPQQSPDLRDHLGACAMSLLTNADVGLSRNGRTRRTPKASRRNFRTSVHRLTRPRGSRIADFHNSISARNTTTPAALHARVAGVVGVIRFGVGASKHKMQASSRIKPPPIRDPTGSEHHRPTSGHASRRAAPHNPNGLARFGPLDVVGEPVLRVRNAGGVHVALRECSRDTHTA